jgi:hypothetical protein
VVDENDLQIGYLSAEYLEQQRERPKMENVNFHRQNSCIQDSIPILEGTPFKWKNLNFFIPT